MTNEQQQGAIVGISSKLITALPSAMLLTLLLNVCFIGALFWLLGAQNASRERALLPLLEACSRTVPLEALPKMFPQQEPHK